MKHFWENFSLAIFGLYYTLSEMNIKERIFNWWSGKLQKEVHSIDSLIPMLGPIFDPFSYEILIQITLRY